MGSSSLKRLSIVTNTFSAVGLSVQEKLNSWVKRNEQTVESTMKYCKEEHLEMQNARL